MHFDFNCVIIEMLIQQVATLQQDLEDGPDENLSY